jgi:hypothetical protein
MKRYKLGIMGMEESEHGEYARFEAHEIEIKDYDALNQRNKEFAEALLKTADDELEVRNKEIFKLKERIADLMEDAKNEDIRRFR